MIRFTTLFHLALNILLIASVFVVWWLFGELMDLAPFSSEHETVQLFVSFGGAFVSVGTIAYRYRQGLNALASYLHIRTSLRTAVSLAEASELAFLFTVNSKGKWYPLYEVVKLPKGQRREYLFAFASDRVIRSDYK